MIFEEKKEEQHYEYEKTMRYSLKKEKIIGDDSI